MDLSGAQDSLLLHLDVPDTATAGQPVRVTFRVENVSGRALELVLRGRTITFDVVVRDGAGRVVWRKLEGEIVPAILRLEPLAAGASLVLETTWGQQSNDRRPMPSGDYSVEAELLTEGEPLRSPRRPLRIL